MDQVSVGLRAPEQQFRQVQVSSPVVSLQELQPLPASTPITVVLKTRPGSVSKPCVAPFVMHVTQLKLNWLGALD